MIKRRGIQIALYSSKVLTLFNARVDPESGPRWHQEKMALRQIALRQMAYRKDRWL